MEQIKNNGLEALVWIVGYFKKNVTVEQLAHSIGMQAASPTEWELRECAHNIGYETHCISITQ